MMVASLPAQQSGLNADMQSSRKLDYVLDSLHNYLIKNGRLPCPSDPSQPTNAGNAGITAQGSGIYSCKTGTPSVPLEDTVNQVAVGGVPYKTLGISSDYAIDGYGRAISYNVDTNAVSCWKTNSLPGAITITDNSVAVGSVVALVSHGKDGHGAWIPLAGTSGSGVRLNSGASDVSELTNAHVDVNFNLITPANLLVKQATTATFDDFVTYQGKNWNINQLPLAMQTELKLTTPANATYKYGSVLVFKLTYPASVTVTGTPRLKLGAITGVSTDGIGSGNVAYANYSSGSGSNVLTFSYTVGSVDSASQGIQLTPAIDLNGGSITVTATGNPACPLTFVAPNLAGVIIYQQFLYAVDYANYQVKKLDLNGNLKLAFGSQGSGNGQFQNFGGIAVDNFGNIWVSDSTLNNVQKFNSAGTWQLTLTGFQFNNDGSQMAVDSANNIWIPQYTNGLISEYSNSGILIGSFTLPSGGTGSDAIAIDASGNLWITTVNANTKFYQCSTSGSCTTYTQQNQKYIDIAIDGAGYLWMTDYSVSQTHKYSAAGAYQSDLSASYGGGQIRGVSIDAAGNIWVAGAPSTNNFIYQYSQSGTLLQTISLDSGFIFIH